MKDLIGRFVRYLPWATIQQTFILAIYILLLQQTDVGWAIFNATAIFTFLHYPNLFLMGTIFIVEPIFLYLYVGPYSLVWMIILHSIMAVSINKYVPDSITKGMRVLWKY